MSRASLLAVSHGTDSAAGRSAIAGLVAAVGAALADVEVLAGFVDVQRPTPGDLLDALAAGPGQEPHRASAGAPKAGAARRRGAPDAGGPAPIPGAMRAAPAPVIVPLLLSAGFHVHVDLASAADGRARLAAALGPDARLAGVAADRLACTGLRPGDAVVMAAAGSSDPAALEDCERAASLLTARLGRTVTTAYLSAAGPSVTDAVVAARRAGASRVVVSPYLLAPGFFWSRAAASGADAVAQPLLAADSAPPRRLVDLVVDRYHRAAGSDGGASRGRAVAREHDPTQDHGTTEEQGPTQDCSVAEDRSAAEGRRPAGIGAIGEVSRAGGARASLTSSGVAV